MNKLHDWAEKEQYKILPKSPIGKAISYFLINGKNSTELWKLENWNWTTTKFKNVN